MAIISVSSMIVFNSQTGYSSALYVCWFIGHLTKTFKLSWHSTEGIKSSYLTCQARAAARRFYFLTSCKDS